MPVVRGPAARPRGGGAERREAKGEDVDRSRRLVHIADDWRFTIAGLLERVSGVVSSTRTALRTSSRPRSVLTTAKTSTD